ncbi:hypothetical protein PNO29_03465 [Streptococcus vestibularis]|uniref:hypothetical protein n=1 Tax=Streptococcus vestibularis TaxID=1343 RepID=UPI00232EC0A0|nr:hypothetical protein [Streptococcus vestibularis]MDB6183944.1 hypothetical protein [Streptococcus vestibularis]MDB6202072.1 hypothetical protein [Streptococcus vestibularis]MDB6207757.1 hypothetical protein [Streptococcus vestibularis]MDB6211876.1 hypothetical protein [Streptococcus vestibularis]MDB6214744.1 hypothetical protein [Streptococcus vestibularis]
MGLIGFVLPVMMIEGPINALVLSGFAHSSKWFTIVYGGLVAGLVEETNQKNFIYYQAEVVFLWLVFQLDQSSIFDD